MEVIYKKTIDSDVLDFLVQRQAAFNKAKSNLADAIKSASEKSGISEKTLKKALDVYVKSFDDAQIGLDFLNENKEALEISLGLFEQEKSVLSDIMRASENA